jgi:hypothetical protein|tara:strand:- start:1966 stop:2244 length:279 start_codon:yes stop_codon:yes gene_type:complete
MKSKRKKNKDLQKIKNRLGVSRKKNYTKERNVETNITSTDHTKSANIPSVVYPKTETENNVTNYPYLKREVFQILGTFSFVLSILIGLTFII